MEQLNFYNKRSSTLLKYSAALSELNQDSHRRGCARVVSMLPLARDSPKRVSSTLSLSTTVKAHANLYQAITGAAL